MIPADNSINSIFPHIPPYKNQSRKFTEFAAINPHFYQCGKPEPEFTYQVLSYRSPPTLTVLIEYSNRWATHTQWSALRSVR